MRRLAPIFALCMLASPARADDVHIDSDSVFQAYEVRSPGLATLTASRRFVQTLSLAWAHDFEPIPEPDGRRPRIGIALTLRLDQQFGETCLVGREACIRATDRGDPSSFQPLARDTLVDAPTAYLEVLDLPWRTDVRAGRQLVFDTIGLARIDGLWVRTQPLGALGAEAFFGALVRNTSFAGTGVFDTVGVPRFDLGDLDPMRRRFVALPRTAWVAGGAIDGGFGSLLRARVAFRETWEDGDAGLYGDTLRPVPGGTLARRLGASVTSQPVAQLHLQADGVLDLLDGSLIAAALDARLATGDTTVFARVERSVPRFDPGTIWAWFVVAPIGELRLGASWRASDSVELSGTLHARRAELDAQHTDHDAGIEGRVAFRVGPLHLGVSSSAWGGDLGPLASSAIDAWVPLAPQARLDLRASLWFVDDANRSELWGTTLSEVLGFRWSFSPETHVVGELEHATSRLVGQRFRFVVSLRVDTWR